MIKVNFIKMNSRVSEIIDANTEIADFCQEHAIDMTKTVYVDGNRVYDFGKTFADIGVTESCLLSVVAKADNAGMIQVKYLRMGDRTTEIVDAGDTVGSFCESHAIDITKTVYVDGNKVFDFGKTFADLGVTESCMLSVVAKADNAAAVKVVGKALVIESVVPFADYEVVRKYNPEALKLKDGDETIFVVSTGSGMGEVNKFGCTFVPDVSGKAVVTTTSLITATDKEAVKQEITDKLGVALRNIAAIEEAIPAVLAEAKAANEAIMASIDL